MRISYSIAKKWWDGYKDEAIRMLNGEDILYPAKLERALGYGTGAHDAWQAEAKKTGWLPAIFNNPDVRVVASELHLYKELRPGDWLSGRIDWLGWHQKHKLLIIGDHKTGSGHDNWQVPVYHLLTHENLPYGTEKGLLGLGRRANNMSPDQFWYTNFDKINGETSVDIVKLTYPETKEEWEAPDATTYTTGYNWILTVIDDIKNDLGLK